MTLATLQMQLKLQGVTHGPTPKCKLQITYQRSIGRKLGGRKLSVKAPDKMRQDIRPGQCAGGSTISAQSVTNSES